MERFNTGRLYTEDGQRIAWQRFEDTGVYFVDLDRMIHGFIGVHESTPVDDAFVLDCYDNYDYTDGATPEQVECDDISSVWELRRKLEDFAKDAKLRA